MFIKWTIAYIFINQKLFIFFVAESDERDKIGCRSWHSNCTSVRNSRPPRSPNGPKRSILTVIVPSSMIPSYRSPKPPRPRRKSSRKLLIAALISSSENCRHSPSGNAEHCFPGDLPFPLLLSNFALLGDLLIMWKKSRRDFKGFFIARNEGSKFGFDWILQFLQISLHCSFQMWITFWDWALLSNFLEVPLLGQRIELPG